MVGRGEHLNKCANSLVMLEFRALCREPTGPRGTSEASREMCNACADAQQSADSLVAVAMRCKSAWGCSAADVSSTLLLLRLLHVM